MNFLREPLNDLINVTHPSKKSQNLPLAALLAYPAREMRSDLAPSLGPVLLDTVHKDSILLLGPGPLHHLRIKNFLPPVQTLDIRTIFELLSDLLPVFGLYASKTEQVRHVEDRRLSYTYSHLSDEVAKLFILE